MGRKIVMENLPNMHVEYCLRMFLWLFQKCVGIAPCALRQEWGNLQLCQLLSTLLQGLGFYTYMKFLLYLTYIGSFGKSKV